MKRIGSRLCAIAAVVTLAALTGCGRTPTAPMLDSMTDNGGPAVASVAKAPQTNGLQPPYTQPDPLDPARSESSGIVIGKLGAVLRAGNVSLMIPKKAFNGRARVTLRVEDPSELNAQMEMSPADKNQFQVPVTVEFDAAACGKDVRGLHVVWLDPATSRWVEVPSVIDLETGKISAQLMKLSDCRAEFEGRLKSGW